MTFGTDVKSSSSFQAKNNQFNQSLTKTMSQNSKMNKRNICDIFKEYAHIKPDIEFIERIHVFLQQPNAMCLLEKRETK